MSNTVASENGSQRSAECRHYRQHTLLATDMDIMVSMSSSIRHCYFTLYKDNRALFKAKSQPVTIIFSGCDRAIIGKIQKQLPNLAGSLYVYTVALVGLLAAHWNKMQYP